MRQLTPAQLEAFALDLTGTIANSNWSDATAALALLNSLQAVYVMNELRQSLSDSALETLAQTMVYRDRMNDPEYFAACQRLASKCDELGL